MTDKSIHPYGRHNVYNTSKSKNRDVLNNKIKALEEHLSRHPKDSVSQVHLKKLQNYNGGN